MRDIALRHLHPFRGTGHWRIPYRDQQNIDVLKNLRDLTGEPVTQDMSLSQQEPDHLWIGNRATQKPTVAAKLCRQTGIRPRQIAGEMRWLLSREVWKL